MSNLLTATLLVLGGGGGGGGRRRQLTATSTAGEGQVRITKRRHRIRYGTLPSESVTEIWVESYLRMC
jgi:hypothetical protein